MEVDINTDSPAEAWKRLSPFNQVIPVSTRPDQLDRWPSKSMLRFVCISDTHGKIESNDGSSLIKIPDGDILIHTGDFSMTGNPDEITLFDSFMSHCSHSVKIAIAGNHEITFEPDGYGWHPTLIRRRLGLTMAATNEEVVAAHKDLLHNVLYLEDEGIQICGLKIYGSPWVPVYGTGAFSLPRGERLLTKWNMIPADTDILLTHGPPLGYGDTLQGDKRAGCVELLNTVVTRVKPRYHVFGHIHDSYGTWTNGTTTFINASICNSRYIPINPPVVFDLPLPVGYTRTDFEHTSLLDLRRKLARQEDANSR